LSNYSFPGNVRELEGIIYDAISVHQRGVLSLETIRKRLQQPKENSTNGAKARSPVDEPLIIPAQFPTMKEAEDFLIEEALRRAEGNQTLAADMLGFSRRALNNRLRRTQTGKGK
jgi:DNA-binding NtrC family response regulator